MRRAACFGLACVALAAAVGTLAGCNRSGGPAVEAIDVRTAAFPVGPTAMLVVESDRGAVTIRGASGRETIDVTTTVRASGPSAELARDRIARLQVSVGRSEDALRLGFHVPADGTSWDASVEFVVRVPVRCAVEVVGGDLDVTVGSISGRLAVAVERGSISVLGGDLEWLSVVSGAGDVEVAGRLGGLGIEHEVHTGRGDVHVRIPPDSRLRIEAEVPAGSGITSALPLSGDLSGRRWSATLNAPDATLRLCTLDGQILIGRLHEA